MTKREKEDNEKFSKTFYTTIADDDFLPYRRLGCAIVQMACQEYIADIRANRNETTASYRMLENEKFFCSEWFDVLMGGRVDGKVLIKQLRHIALDTNTKKICSLI